MNFFYDQQISRYLLQFIRIFSDIKIESDPDQYGNKIQKRVPIKYGDMSRSVAHIIQDNSPNTLLTAPSMSVIIKSLDRNDGRRQDPMFVGVMQGAERKYNAEQGSYGSEIGNKYTVERYMPVPYDLTLQLDIWTTNVQNKLQIIEQIATIFNPSIQLQQNDNPFDWSGIFEVELKTINWTNRNIPALDAENDFASITFQLPIWINPPAKLKRQRIIQKIITNVFQGDESDPTLLTNMVFTPGNFKADVFQDEGIIKVKLLGNYSETTNLTWDDLTSTYGKIIPNVTIFKIKISNDIEDDSTDVSGTITNITNDILTLAIDVDTTPTVSLYSPITRIIDPVTQTPGFNLPSPVNGTKYLLISSTDLNETTVIENNVNWPGITIANENDIIEYNSGAWSVIFDSVSSTSDVYISNLQDSQLYRYDGNTWIYAILGTYNPGYWYLNNIQPL